MRRTRGSAIGSIAIVSLRTRRSITVTVRVGINGFGRIGRNFFRAVRASDSTSRSSESTT